MAIYRGQPGWASIRTLTLRNINPIQHHSCSQILHKHSHLLSEASLIPRRTRGKWLKKNEEPDNKNPHFLNNRLILDLAMALVNRWSPLTHISHCMTTSWTSSHTDESKSKPHHAIQGIFMPDVIPAATLSISFSTLILCEQASRH